MWQVPKTPGVYVVVPRATPWNLSLWQMRKVNDAEEITGELLNRCMFYGPIPVDFPSPVIDTGKYHQ
jgi:hypothetical protein